MLQTKEISNNNKSNTPVKQCDNCHDAFKIDDLKNMKGIADGQFWCTPCWEKFKVFYYGA